MKIIESLFIDYKVLLYGSVGSSLLIVLLESAISLFVFCPLGLSASETDVLRSSTKCGFVNIGRLSFFALYILKIYWCDRL